MGLVKPRLGAYASECEDSERSRAVLAAYADGLEDLLQTVAS